MKPPFFEMEEVAVTLGRAFDELGIRYLVGGSVASSLMGEPRATNDIDVLVELSERQVDELSARLGPDFEVDAESLKEAVRRRGSWNIFYLPLVTKVDLFIKRLDPFDAMELDRRVQVKLAGGSLFVATAEDILLRKLEWFRRGGEASSSQWRDVLGVLRVSGQTIDRAHVALWSQRLGVTDLWRRACTEAGLPE